MEISMLRLTEVLRRTGYPRSTLYLRVQQGLWVHPVRIGGRTVGWPGHEIDALLAARMRSVTDDELRTLVRRLEDERAHIGRHAREDARS